MIKRRKTIPVKIGNITIGGNHPITIQSMTNTPTADTQKTLNQILELISAGSELVRITINDNAAAQSAVKIIQELRRRKIKTPIIGDFHYNGHLILRDNPQCAKLLDKYRINPGNVGKGKTKSDNFAQIIKIAIKNKKPVRIGVNWGSLDEELLAQLIKKASNPANSTTYRKIVQNAMIQSALQNAQLAKKLGLPENKIVLSVKMSDLNDMVNVYESLSKKCKYPLHLGLTEAGGSIEGITASTAALAILLHKGIGDTLRISLTPQKGEPRSKEVEVAKALLQSMSIRHFEPKIISCPGCGRTKNDYFETLAGQIRSYVKRNIPLWRKKYKGTEHLAIAVMGCVVNGPGESKHADIAISLPGAGEKPIGLVYAKGKKIKDLSGKHLYKKFIIILEEFLKTHYKKK